MDQSPHIYAVTVNHNTSHFVELMLRTLFLTNDLAGLRFEMTVLNNQSDDPHADNLRAGRGMDRENFYESDWVKQQRQQLYSGLQSYRQRLQAMHLQAATATYREQRPGAGWGSDAAAS